MDIASSRALAARLQTRFAPGMTVEFVADGDGFSSGERGVVREVPPNGQVIVRTPSGNDVTVYPLSLRTA